MKAMLFLVLQRKNWLQARLNDIRNQGNILEFPPKFNLEKVELTHIGTSNYKTTDMYWLEMLLGSIWTTCQNEYEYLSDETEEEKEVTFHWRKQSRSLDVGDLIQLEDNRLFRVETCGFKQIKQPPLVHISQTHNHRGLVDHFPTLKSDWMKDAVTEKLTFTKGDNSAFYCLETCQNYQDKSKYQRLR